MPTQRFRRPGLRSLVALVTIVAFSIAALMGIAVLLRGGELGDTESKILGTTSLIGFVSLLVLGCLTRGGRAVGIVGAVGVVVTVVPFVAGLVLLWWSISVPSSDYWFRAFAAGSVVAFSFAHVAVLLGMTVVTRFERVVRALTLALIAALASMLVAMILRQTDFGETFLRIVGIVAILDLLGTIALPGLSRMRPVRRTSPADAGLADPTVNKRLSEIAVREGRTPNAVLAAALDAYEAAPRVVPSPR